MATLLPFVASMEPSEKSRAAGAPVTVDISRLQPGVMITVPWRGVPVSLVNLTPAMLRAVVIANSVVADPSTERAFSMSLPDYCIDREEFECLRGSQPDAVDAHRRAESMRSPSKLSSQVPARNAFGVLNIAICNNAEQYLRRSLCDSFIAP